jgi:TetR/AcrR family transcriptional repressor of nem operon
MPALKLSKEEIINIAIGVFRTKGYHSTSMDDLAKACGLRKGSFYHHFKDKEALMHAVLDTVHGYFKYKIFSIAYDEDLTAEERLTKILTKSKRLFIEMDGGCIFGNMVLETIGISNDFKDKIKLFFDDWAVAMAHIYEDKYSKKEAMRIAKQSIADWEGAVMMMQLYDDKQYILDTADRIAQKLK